MRKVISIIPIFIVCVSFNVNGQSIVKTAESKSGILVGTQNASEFAGITYERSTDEFLFNYKLSQQRSYDNPGPYFPDFRGINIELGYDLSKDKSGFIAEEKWQGGAHAGFMLTFTNDNTALGTRNEDQSTVTKYAQTPGGTGRYPTYRSCMDATNGPCVPIPTTVTNYIPFDIKQRTFFFGIEEKVSRVNYALEVGTKRDSTFLALKDDFQSKLTFTIGNNWLRQYNEKFYLSWAISLNASWITASSKGLKTAKILPTSRVYFNETDSSMLSNTSDIKEYALGKMGEEFEIIPRADIFFRCKIGDERPLVGLIGSVSPITSSVKGVKSRWNFAVGPSFSPAMLPDQVMFALMSEWLQDAEGDFNYSLTFHASFPLKFK